ncbi:MAG: amidohydrolase [Planctomycetales bacterium]|nr:amidohydrolase [Planctomycetales bacterium]
MRYVYLAITFATLASRLASADDPSANLTLAPQTVQQIQTLVAAEYPSLDALYKHLHSHPELSLAERETSARIAEELRDAGCQVTEKVGGYGVVGVLENGDGPTIMIRADMDALPIVEQTGLSYASRVTAKDKHGQTVGVMHACGHDVNMTCLVGTARMMNAMRDKWTGTIVFVGQPAEEIGAGAEMMLADGLFHRFPRPDLCLATHCDARYPHGHINFRSGQMQANVDSVDITVLGKGGHGAAPHTTIDPIVIAARLVVDLQTIVSRELNPLSPAVVTVGSIHGGTKHNIIPDEVKLQLTVRTTTDEVREHTLAAIRRIAKAAAAAANAPEPRVEIDERFTPSLVNDPELTARTVGLFRQVFGEDRIHERPMSLGGEDFSRYIRAGVPGFYYFIGSAPPELVAAARANGPPLTQTHTNAYYPIPKPTITTGVVSMTSAVMALMKPEP